MTEQQIPTAPSGSQGEMNSSLAPHRGGLILALGIIGIVCCFICGIVAWVMGNNDLQQMDEGRMDPSGRGLTQGGKICGIVSVALAILGLVVWLIMMVVGIGTSGMHF
jgi:flagellar biogenesis protein FliO